MASVFSEQFISHASLTGGPYDEYVVPAGYVAVVKTITIIWGDVAVSGIDAWVQLDNLTKLWRYTWASTLSDVTNFGGSSRFWGSHVCKPGQIIQAQTVAGTCDVQAGGYLLKLP